MDSRSQEAEGPGSPARNLQSAEGPAGAQAGKATPLRSPGIAGPSSTSLAAAKRAAHMSKNENKSNNDIRSPKFKKMHLKSDISMATANQVKSTKHQDYKTGKFCLQATSGKLPG